MNKCKSIQLSSMNALLVNALLVTWEETHTKKLFVLVLGHFVALFYAIFTEGNE